MAIAFQTSATGSSVGTTSLTIALSSTAGDVIVVAVAISATGTTVSSITDAGGNAYHQVGTQTSSTTIRTDLWKTDSVKPAASGTITVNFSSATGNKVAVAGSYRGVAFAGTAAGNGTSANSGTITTGAQTLQETNSWVVAAMGAAADNVQTAGANTSLRNQQGSTSIHVGLADSNDTATPATVSVTQTSSRYVAVWNQLRLLESTQLDSMTLSDALSRAIPITTAVADQMTLSDGPVSRQNVWALDIVCPHLADNWADALPVIEYGIALSDFPQRVPPVNGDTTWLDVLTGVGYGNVVQDTLNNWADLFQFPAFTLLTVQVSDTLNNWADLIEFPAATLLTVQVSDTLNNWLDALAGMGYGNVVQDQMTFTDQMTAGYGSGLSDQLVLTDSLGAGYGALLSDTLNNWADALTGMGYGSVFSDQMLLTDSLTGMGYGNVVQDQMILTDQMGAGYGSVFSDQLILTDSLGAGYGAQLSDSLNNWLDALTGMGYGNVVQDQMILSDQMGAGYGSGFSDQLVLVDSLGTGYGAQLSDTLNNWADALQRAVVQLLTVADTLNNWADALGAGYGSALSDQLVLVDSLGAGYGALLSDTLNNWADVLASQLLGALISIQLTDTLNFWLDAVTAGYGSALSDQLVLSDSLAAGYGAQLSDTLNFWADQLQLAVAWQLAMTDSLNNWLDALTGMGYGNVVQDQLQMSDQMGAGYGSGLSDQLILTDSLGAGYGALLSDSLNNWADLLQLFLQGALLSIQLSDTLNFWADLVLVGYGSGLSDQLVLADSLGAGYGAQLSDTLNSWADSLQRQMGVALTLTDSLNNWADVLGVGYGNAIADQMTFTDQMGAGYGSAFSDQMILTDSTQAGYGALLSDSLNNWLDALQRQLSVALQLQDSLNNWAEALQIGYGNLLQDQLIGTDQLGLGYGFQLSDTLNFWADAYQQSVLSSILTLPLTDTLNFWTDVLGLGYGNVLNDGLGWSDQLGLGYGFALQDTMANWADQFQVQFLALLQLTVTDTLNFWLDALGKEFSVAVTVVDQMSMGESVLIGYGFRVEDVSGLQDTLGVGYGFLLQDATLNNWTDAWQATTVDINGILLTLSDATLQHWLDALHVVRITPFKRARFRAAACVQRIHAETVYVRQPRTLM